MQLPQGVSISLEPGLIKVSGPKGEVQKKFDVKTIGVKVDGTEVTVSTVGKKLTKPLKAALGAVESHIRNMVHGVQHGYDVKLALVYSHFPVTVESKGETVLIKNFLGEKTPRVVKVKGKVKVSIAGQEITVSGINKEEVGQVASSLIEATDVGHRDERVFQDGIYYA
ncbi:50S ribosomal protein L6 [Candidatus Micrarchaeota archaeon]|nr:50S ribosomal protein L6 [Candidatus Micrarchaeota archaeon]